MYAVCLFFSLYYIYIYHSEDGEHCFLWVLQAEGEANRLPLPGWMSQVIEMRICRFVTETEQWATIIGKRAFQGLSLTKSQQERHDRFKASLVQKLVFNKKKQAYVGDASTLKRGLKDCITLVLHLSEEPELLTITSGSGQVYRLMLLKQVRSEVDVDCPKVLDHPARPDDIMNKAYENEDEGDEDGQMPEAFEAEEYSEAAARQMDDDRYDMENGQVQDDMENGFFLLADSDEEIDLPALHLPAGTTTTKVKSFHLRQAWIDLENEGLCELPRHIAGCSISYHATTRQWQKDIILVGTPATP